MQEKVFFFELKEFHFIFFLNREKANTHKNLYRLEVFICFLFVLMNCTQPSGSFLMYVSVHGKARLVLNAQIPFFHKIPSSIST